MEEEIYHCEQPMVIIGGIGKLIELGEFVQHKNPELAVWHQTGVREQKLYQCNKCKKIQIY